MKTTRTDFVGHYPDNAAVAGPTWKHDLKSACAVEPKPLTLGAAEKQILLASARSPASAQPLQPVYGRADWLRGGNVRRG